MVGADGSTVLWLMPLTYQLFVKKSESVFKWAKPGLFFAYFRSFHTTKIAQILLMVCLGFEPGVAEW